MRILVTGGNGFVGGHLIDDLVERGHDVVSIVRKAGSSSARRSVAVGDIGSTTSWENVFAPGDCVVHLAARVHVMHREPGTAAAMYEEVNTLGTAHLARRAAAAGVRRLVYLSSIKVNGEATQDKPFQTDDVPAPLDAYGVSKWHAEQALQKISAETGLETVIIRIPLVYGPGVKGNFLRLLRLLSLGIPLPLASVTNRRSLVYVRNLTDFIAQCLVSPSAVGETFLVADDEDLSTPDLLRRLAAIMKRSPRLIGVPVGLLRGLAAIAGARNEIERLTGSLVVDSSRARSTLGWAPRFSVDEGLRSTVRWFLEKHNNAR